MSGSVLTAFNDFIEGTGSQYVTDPKKIINLAGFRTYYWGKFFGNNKKTVQGGEDINFSFIARDNGTFEETLPGQNFNWVNPQRLQKGTINYRYTQVHQSWVDQEILLNDKIKFGDFKTQFEQFVDIASEKEMLAWTAMANGLERQCFAVPNKTLMEGTGSTMISPYSFFSFVNQGTNGLFGSGYVTAVNGGPWTVVENVDPAAAAIDGQFSPQQVSYNTHLPDFAGNIIGGLDKLWMQSQWEVPEMMSKYYEDPALNNQQILTSLQGRQAYMSLLRAGQDRFIAGPQDPAYPDPQFHGVPVKRCQFLETATVYDSATASPTVAPTTEGLAAGNHKKGPRFYMWNGNYIYPVVHDERYFYKDKPTRHHNVPDTWVMRTVLWWNMICTSRKHQGVLFPSADTYDDAARGGNLYA